MGDGRRPTSASGSSPTRPRASSSVLRQYSAGSGDGFDEFRTGMDHLAFGVESAEELAEWETKLTSMGATFTPAAETPIGTVIVFRDPDDIQLEFWLPAT